jgi:hypothetical protein
MQSVLNVAPKGFEIVLFSGIGPLFNADNPATW